MDNKYRKISNQDIQEFEKYHQLKEQDWYNNQFHLSAYSGLINDPNGLVYFQGQYYIFMQNSPFSPQHFNKSWILYTTKDFINYDYHGIVLTPSISEDEHGVFSGSAFVWENQLRFYYTGNVKYLETNTRSSYTIEASFDFKNKVAYKKPLFKTDNNIFTGHFRDPVVHFNQANKKFYMLNGAQNLKEEGVLVVHETADLNQEFKLKNIIDLNIFKNYMIECPNFFEINKKKALIVSPEQNIAYKDGSHFVYYQVGDFNKDYSKFESTHQWEQLDFGYEFYAPQIFNNSSRNLMVGWNGNSHGEQKATYESMWSNNLTIPRELKLANDKIIQSPVEELKKLRLQEIKTKNNFINYENGLVEINFNNQNEEFDLTLSNEKNQSLKIKYCNQKFVINRENCTFVDDLNLPNEISLNVEVKDLHILIDRSSIEMFINQGSKTISLRFYLMNHNKITFSNVKPTCYQLQGFKINSHNSVWENQEIK